MSIMSNIPRTNLFAKALDRPVCFILLCNQLNEKGIENEQYYFT